MVFSVNAVRGDFRSPKESRGVKFSRENSAQVILEEKKAPKWF